MDGTVYVEVQRANGLSNSEYRFGDITSKVLGCRRVRPYVNCRILFFEESVFLSLDP